MIFPFDNHEPTPPPVCVGIIGCGTISKAYFERCRLFSNLDLVACADGSRGLGVADLAAALVSGRDHRANERLALHALEIMEAIHVSAAEALSKGASRTAARARVRMEGWRPEQTGWGGVRQSYSPGA